jgi:hypothetical protein
LGQRVADILSISGWLSQSKAGATSVSIWARDRSALCASFAAALDEGVSRLVLEEPLLGFESVVTVTGPAYGNEIILPGVLESVDLPQVYQAICPRELTLIRPLRGDGNPASRREVDAAYQSTVATYTGLGEPDRWRVFAELTQQERSQVLLSALAAKAADVPEEGESKRANSRSSRRTAR